jgi:hypothetical protein
MPAPSGTRRAAITILASSARKTSVVCKVIAAPLIAVTVPSSLLMECSRFLTI